MQTTKQRPRASPALELEADRAADRVANAKAPAIRHEPLSAVSQPLDSGTRAFMESRLGHDFSGVRVHADAQAGRSARAIGARAYTTGTDIVFAPGQYAPGTAAGRSLLAHELTHVVQQRGRGKSVQCKVEEKTPCTVQAYDNSNPKDTAIVPSDGSGVGVSSVPDLVTKVNAYVDDPKNNCKCLSRLDINGHGTDGYQSVGLGSTLNHESDKALSYKSTEEHLQQVTKIKFCPTALFTLIGCHVGRGDGKTLLHRLSTLLPGKLIGGAQHYTSPTAAGGARVLGEGDTPGPGLTVPRDKSDPFLQSRFVRWHLTIGGKEYVIEGDEAATPEGQSKLKAADKVKLKTPEGKIKVIK